MASVRIRHLRLDGPDVDARRHADATRLYNDLVVCQTRENAIKLIDRALLFAHIAGANASVITHSRRELQRRRRASKGV